MTYQIQTIGTTALRGSHVDYNPVTAAYEKFILLESEHFSQLLGGRQTLTGTNPLYGNLSFLDVVSTTETAPDGTATAAKVGATTTNAGHIVQITNVNNTTLGGSPTAAFPGGHRSVVCAVKAGTITVVSVGFFNGTFYKFDLSTGTADAGNPDTKYRIRKMLGDNPASSGWYEIYTVNYTNDATAQNFYIQMVKGGATSFAGAAADADYFYVWKSNVELGSYVPQGLAQQSGLTFPAGNGGTNGKDQLVVPLPTSLQTPQSMTIYMEWLDRGNGLKSTAPGVFRLGDLAGTGDGISITQSSTGFDGTLTLGGSTSTSSVSLVPDVGDLVALRAVVGSDGKLTLYAGKNGAAETTGTTGSAVTLSGSWSDNLVTPNSIGATLIGDMALRKLKMYAGVVSAATASA